MSVNLSGKQNIEQFNAETNIQAKEIQTQQEYNRSLELYKSTMSTFNLGNNCDEYASIFLQNAKLLNEDNKTKTTKKFKEPSTEHGIVAKATDWIANLLGIDLDKEEDPLESLQTYEEVFPGAGFSRTTKEYQMMLKELHL